MPTLDSISLLRRGILALLALGCVGLLSELVLLEHYEQAPQYIPFVLLVLTLASILWHWIDGGVRSLRAFQSVMLLLIVAGITGSILHLRGNVQMEREFDPGLAGFPFWLAVIRGEAPLLAPGTLIQFGLLGLLYGYRHPALTSEPRR